MKHLTDEEIKQTYRRLFPRGAYILDESVVLFGRALLKAAGASEPDVVAVFENKHEGQREWHSVGAWLHPGEAIAIIDWQEEK